MARRPLLPNCIIPDRIVALLTHTNILKIFDIDRRGGAIRDVLEYRLYTLETGELLLRCPSAIDGP